MFFYTSTQRSSVYLIIAAQYRSILLLFIISKEVNKEAHSFAHFVNSHPAPNLGDHAPSTDDQSREKIMALWAVVRRWFSKSVLEVLENLQKEQTCCVTFVCSGLGRGLLAAWACCCKQTTSSSLDTIVGKKIEWLPYIMYNLKLRIKGWFTYAMVSCHGFPREYCTLHLVLYLITHT